MSKSFFLYFLLSIAPTLVLGNDGHFRAAGNHLIPMHESRITVKKEILDIRMLKRGLYEVSIYYEFFNPDTARTLDIGFEAEPPNWTEGVYKLEEHKHPFIYDFTVNMNNEALAHQVAMVNDSHYYRNGRFINIPDSSKKLAAKQAQEMRGLFNFTYVYHFKARFKPGLNIIRHTYTYEGSRNNSYSYLFSYILTTANRWGNKRIDDFTLNLDMGNFRNFEISPRFFQSAKEWKIRGNGRVQDTAYPSYFPESDELDTFCAFYVRDGIATFHKLNFSPSGELYLHGKDYWVRFETPFDHTEDQPTFDPEDFHLMSDSVLKKSEKILRNLPYARRGYVSPDKDVQKYYESLSWYWPDPSYKADAALLTEEERKWLKRLLVEK